MPLLLLYLQPVITCTLIPVGPENIAIVIPLSNFEISSLSASVGRRLNGPVWRKLAELR